MMELNADLPIISPVFVNLKVNSVFVARLCSTCIYHIFPTFFTAITQSLHIWDKLFPANWLSACCDDNRKPCILNGERLSCLARDVDQHKAML